jgi:hypothetical protein
MTRCAGLRVTLRAPSESSARCATSDAFSAVTTHSCATCYTYAPFMRHFRATDAPPGCESCLPLPPARSDAPSPPGGPAGAGPRPAAGGRQHRFPRSHGPAEHEVNGIMVKASLPPTPAPQPRDMDRLARTRAWPKKCRMNPKAAEILAYPRKGARKSGVAHGRHALSPPGDERGEASSRFDARSPRATRCISAGRPGSGCSRSWDSSPRSPMPAAA